MLRLALPLLSAFALLAACTDDPEAIATPCNLPVLPEGQGVARQQVFQEAFPNPEDLNFAMQLVQSPDVEGRWYLVRQLGTIAMFDEGLPGHTLAFDLRDDPRLMLGDRPGLDERGILSMSFHPSGNFAFVTFTAPPTIDGAVFDSRVSRFDLREDGTLDTDSERMIITVPQPGFPHSGNHTVFGPDGYLYFAVGDGGGANDQFGNGQNLDTVAAAILRMDVDPARTTDAEPYLIPEDNPFAGGAAPEIFAYGLRNVWRFSFDRELGTLWAGDVGQNSFEEVNVVERGANYGWPILEGVTCVNAESCDTAGLVEPRVVYGRNLGQSVTGGFVYRGSAIPEWTGRYIYGDFMVGNVFSVGTEPGSEPEREFEALHHGLVSFAERRDGELFYVRWSFEGAGGIYQFVPGETQSGSVERRLSETGCFNEDMTAPSSAFIDYDPTSILWSDGADKERSFALPEGGAVTLNDDGDFVFPEGTILHKSFGFDGSLHETRFLALRDGRWFGYSYRWNEDGTDAVLNDGRTETLENGLSWSYPTRGQCNVCHTSAAGFSLGLELAQIGDSLDPHIAAGEVDRVASTRRPDLAEIDDESASLEARARSYLHTNCAGCHRENGPTQAQIDLRFEVPLLETGICDVAPNRGTLGRRGPDAEALRIVAPGVPEQSVLSLRMRDRGVNQMPPIATTIVDEEAVAVVDAWIASLGACE
ncbi:MAG: PQQ-dependent sugar dehydrogenase [Myxococcota bacterium]